MITQKKVTVSTNFVIFIVTGNEHENPFDVINIAFDFENGGTHQTAKDANERCKKKTENKKTKCKKSNGKSGNATSKDADPS